MFVAYHLLRHCVSEGSAIRDPNNWYYCAFFLVYLVSRSAEIKLFRECRRDHPTASMRGGPTDSAPIPRKV